MKNKKNIEKWDVRKCPACGGRMLVYGIFGPTGRLIKTFTEVCQSGCGHFIHNSQYAIIREEC